ncbi:hypothetical protein GCM10023347_34180 [Streptomyces chumphonensis]|uniref:Uncharacterized protein n=1 Tax=Streptomyces chumphonensis TaxID=1214925 RepID=A0A927F039_9ACTN|nr:hypothetical protein [Streptomyces chumphonensis]MBD3931912.1 hypothetical protein [Streptomyces chumphonensis]
MTAPAAERYLTPECLTAQELAAESDPHEPTIAEMHRWCHGTWEVRVGHELAAAGRCDCTCHREVGR